MSCIWKVNGEWSPKQMSQNWQDLSRRKDKKRKTGTSRQIKYAKRRRRNPSWPKEHKTFGLQTFLNSSVRPPKCVTPGTRSPLILVNPTKVQRWQIRCLNG